MRSWIALLALTSFAVPAIGAQLHLCLDGAGTEPPTSVHVADISAHHPANTASDHHDVDVSLDREVLAKKSSSPQDAENVLPAAPVLFVRPVASTVDLPRGPPATFVRAAPYRILPPLRAPPV
jgi:hypothetical protein